MVAPSHLRIILASSCFTARRAAAAKPLTKKAQQSNSAHSVREMRVNVPKHMSAQIGSQCMGPPCTLRRLRFSGRRHPVYTQERAKIAPRRISGYPGAILPAQLQSLKAFSEIVRRVESHAQKRRDLPQFRYVCVSGR